MGNVALSLEWGEASYDGYSDARARNCSGCATYVTEGQFKVSVWGRHLPHSVIDIDKAPPVIAAEALLPGISEA